MRLCIPTVDDGGVNARLSPHFGSAPFFTLVEDGTRRSEVMVNDKASHRHGACMPVDELRLRGVDAVICRGLGARALAHLQTMGIAVLVTDRWDVAGALSAFDAGVLTHMTDDQACLGHGHHATVGAREP